MNFQALNKFWDFRKTLHHYIYHITWSVSQLVGQLVRLTVNTSVFLPPLSHPPPKKKTHWPVFKQKSPQFTPSFVSPSSNYLYGAAKLRPPVLCPPTCYVFFLLTFFPLKLPHKIFFGMQTANNNSVDGKLICLDFLCTICKPLFQLTSLYVPLLPVNGSEIICVQGILCIR